MTDKTAKAFRAVSFGDLDGELWGTAIDGELRALGLGTPVGTAQRLGATSLGWTASGERWTLTADGLELVIEPCDQPADAGPPNGDGGAGPANGGVDQLCHVSGRVTIDGVEREVDLQGTRTRRDQGVNLPELDSLRGVFGWFGAGEGFSLLSLRPRKAADHSRDAVTASLFGPAAWRTVVDSRLSTTYDADGAPTRVGLELWLEEGDDQYPRRAAGEVAGPAVDVQANGLKLRMAPLRCHSRGREGVGVYLLARRA